MKTRKKLQTQTSKRDGNIQLHISGQISLSTRTVRDKTKYTRKTKHKQVW